MFTLLEIKALTINLWLSLYAKFSFLVFGVIPAGPLFTSRIGYGYYTHYLTR